MKKIILTACVLFYIIAIAGCKKQSSNGPISEEISGKEFFVSATPAGNFSKVELQQVATIKGYGTYVPLIQYDVDFFRIIYRTTFKGKQIEASGLLCIPKNMPTVPALLSAQHGTMFSDAEAPSNFPATFTGFELFASTGFVTAIPDFIGYGISKDIVHPYYDMQSAGLSVVDMLKAVKYYLKTKNSAINDKLFLLGYSEGGYVTMAAQREIETNANHRLSLTAAAAGAGGYDLSGMLSQVATVDSYTNPSFLALLIHGYNTTYNWNRPFTDFFANPYAAKFPALLDGTKDGDQIDSALNNSPLLLFCSTFYKNLMKPTGEIALKTKIVENSFPNWYPKCPLRLYHGTADEAVFFSTSQTTFNRFIAAGATKTAFFPIPGGTHQTSVTPMMLNALPWMLGLSK
ncbi:MAG: alpha/beta hydrolase family protein [Sphingobacteriaceae bacterium]